jgi:hypothetical protein
MALLTTSRLIWRATRSCCASMQQLAALTSFTLSSSSASVPIKGLCGKSMPLEDYIDLVRERARAARAPASDPTTTSTVANWGECLRSDEPGGSSPLPALVQARIPSPLFPTWVLAFLACPLAVSLVCATFLPCQALLIMSGCLLFRLPCLRASDQAKKRRVPSSTSRAVARKTRPGSVSLLMHSAQPASALAVAGSAVGVLAARARSRIRSIESSTAIRSPRRPLMGTDADELRRRERRQSSELPH